MLDYDDRRRTANRFSLESLGICAVSAMKEEALMDYDEALLNFDYVDVLHPSFPLRITMDANAGAPMYKTRRSSVMWALRSLTVGMMSNRLFTYIPFIVDYNYRILYRGRLTDRGGPTNPVQTKNSTLTSAWGLNTNLSLAAIPTNTSNTVLLQGHSSLQNHPQYDITFQYVGQRLSAFRIFESLLQLLLELGKSDAASSHQLISMQSRPFQVWIYMMQVSSLVEGHPFQQFQAVAILEAMARYVVSQGRYGEMTFEFRADGQLVARGCLTRSVQYLAYCQEFFPPGVSSIATS